VESGRARHFGHGNEKGLRMRMVRLLLYPVDWYVYGGSACN
jgi:hypothetical protein